MINVGHIAGTEKLGLMLSLTVFGYKRSDGFTFQLIARLDRPGR